MQEDPTFVEQHYEAPKSEELNEESGNSATLSQQHPEKSINGIFIET